MLLRKGQIQQLRGGGILFSVCLEGLEVPVIAISIKKAARTACRSYHDRERAQHIE